MSPRSNPRTPRLPFDEPAAPLMGLPDAADRAAAVDPTENVVLEASAGTGKTRVLVDRYTNLVKAGVNPRNILAITFTRKAAAEMRQRILQNLTRAAGTGEISPARWRDLRDRLGEVAISTIDAFCLSLLREFPLEADLDPGFTLADETEVLRLLDEGLDRALRICRRLAVSDPAVALVFAQLGDARLRGGLAVLLERRLVAHAALRRFLVRGPAHLTPASICQDAAERLRRTLGSAEGGLARFLADGPRHHPRFALLAHDIETLVAREPPAGDAGSTLLQQIRLLIDGLEEHFLTGSGEPRTRWRRYNAGHADSPDAWKRHRERAAGLAPRIAEDVARFRRDVNVVLAQGVWRVFEVALAEHRRTLEAHGALDFPDTLWRTLDLLEKMDEFAQSRYLLEARYHHLLVDEFQDTSQAQWELVWRLVQAWGAGIGIDQDAPLRPSIFIVGDRKQSIYGFRDADVSVLARAALGIAGLRPTGQVRRSIRKSFRAVPALLAFTNDLFDAVEKERERPDAFSYGETDRFPVDGPPAGEPVVGLVTGADLTTCAERVATEVDALLAGAAVRDRETGLARPARPGDIGILFRSREGHQALEAALDARGIRPYVYKGLGFFDAEEIKDVFALLRYLANPASDLRAAALLRSRLVRLSDRALQRLGPGVAEALRAPVSRETELDEEDRRVLSHARSACAAWLGMVDCVPPAELLDRILEESAYAVELRGGHVAQARENLKKVRGLARRIQNRGYATLARVAEHLDRLSVGDESNAAIDAVDAVSLMTVHAAKGLEFPIIFVVNIGRGAGGSRPPIRLVADAGGGEPAVSIGEYQSDTDADAVNREREESKRLLYVAVTRARDRLYLSAVTGERFQPARGSLADVLPRSFLDTMIEASIPAGREIVEWSGATMRHRLRVCRAVGRTRASGGNRREAAPARVDAGPVADDPAAMRPVGPAGAMLPPAPAFDAGPDANQASRLVGALVHRLFEQLELAQRESDGELARRATTLVRTGDRASVGDVERAVLEAVQRFRQLADRPDVRELLSSGERLHEVPFAMPHDDGVVHGTIDCLVVRGGDVTVLELKTGRAASSHQQQLAVYVEAARALFPPPRRVRGMLVYPAEVVWVDGAGALG